MAGAMSSRSSGITGTACNLSNFLDQDEISTMGSSARESLSSDWTDEKHSMYLKSMEASFVDQLYSSMNSSACLAHNKCRSRMRSTKLTEACAPNEFKVHQYGNWRSIKFDKGEPPPQETEECRHFLQGNQWLQHYRVDIRKYHIVRGNTSVGSPPRNSGMRMMHSSAGQEYSDQNFDEDNEEGASGANATKRAKIAKSPSSKYKEVVFGRSRSSDLSLLHSSSADGQIGNDWQTSKSNS